MKSRPFTTIIILCILRTCTAVSQCYYPNGRVAITDFPCDPDAETSPCCAGSFGTVCLSNKLCQGADGNVIRGSCTDSQFGSSSCALYCLSARLGGTDLISCSNVTGNSASYCCDHTVNCCDRGVGRFDVLPANPHTWATWAAVSTGFVVVRALSTSTSTSTTSATGTSTSTPPAGDTSPASVPQQGHSGLPAAAYAGIGVGSVIGALFIAAVFYLVWRLRKQKAGTENAGEVVAYGPPLSSTHGQHVPKELPLEPEPREVQGDNDWNSHSVPRPPTELPGHTYH
ncbi:hypothetical protein QBC38DRAFT_374464 [Podospora fimiseda]|uniref:Mid2 domain-containing protein n=1 Tax=Podospora fimiseda TaxID=252190 RepID=A0AAN7BFV5_9PEZI|nr:hypothetical protein QBC38DRAFT_374464 [Podospora fimiseda]